MYFNNYPYHQGVCFVFIGVCILIIISGEVVKSGEVFCKVCIEIYKNISNYVKKHPQTSPHPQISLPSISLYYYFGGVVQWEVVGTFLYSIYRNI